MTYAECERATRRIVDLALIAAVEQRDGLVAELWVAELRANSWQARAEGLEREIGRLRAKIDAMADEIDADAFDAG